MLHITQPTLSRQLMQLEVELGVTLFRRGRRSIHLTPEGLLLKHRAQGAGTPGGESQTGSHPSRERSHWPNRHWQWRNPQYAHAISADALLSAETPLVQFNLYSAASDDIRERLEQGALDLGLLLEPTESGKYDVLRMPHKERWSVLLREGFSLSAQSSSAPKSCALSRF